MTPPLVRIEYHRPPDRDEVFEQHLVHADDDVLVTLARDLTFDPPITIHDRIALETGSSAVWFTFPGAWHDIGRFHRADGTFTGVYANILTPPEILPDHLWRTTDLFLDVWLPADGGVHLLDEDQFNAAIDAGWVDEDTASRALAEAETLVGGAGAGTWPPPVVEAWTLERALEAAAGS